MNTIIDEFDNNVFLNCPFDDDYLPILRAVVFCILDLGFVPRIALERLDSGESRIEKIIELIESSRLGIHDLSRLQAKKAGEFYRLNMPFELGLDVGCRRFKSGRWSAKRCLILESERFRFQAALSDLSNSDIATHADQPIKAMTQVRNWLAGQRPDKHTLGPTGIWNRFNDFTAWSYDHLKVEGFSDHDIDALEIRELIESMKNWLKANPL